jgi:hypothetical protein
VNEEQLAGLTRPTIRPAPVPAETKPATARPSAEELSKADEKLSSLLGDSKK